MSNVMLLFVYAVITSLEVSCCCNLFVCYLIYTEELWNYSTIWKTVREFLGCISLLKDHLLNLVRIEHSHEHTEMPSVCNVSVLKPLQG